jgi:nitroreductase
MLERGVNMQDLIDLIKSRRTIRKYKLEQIKDEELNMIIESGLYAPSSGGRQYPKFLVLQDKDTLLKLGKINRMAFGCANSDKIRYVSMAQPSIADTNDIKNGFYDAPTVIAIFTPKNWDYSIHDAVMAAAFMTLTAWSLGIGSCFVSRSEETFESDFGQEIIKKAGLDKLGEEYIARAFLTLGYPDGEIGNAKPRENNRVIILS